MTNITNNQEAVSPKPQTETIFGPLESLTLEQRAFLFYFGKDFIASLAKSKEQGGKQC